jgi:hypothetical protein
MKIYKRSIYEDQKYTISFGTEEDLKDWKEEELSGVSTDKNIGALLNTINKIIREDK